MSAEVSTKEGLNWLALLFDELHAQKTPQLFEALQYGCAARRQPLLITISTAGFDRESIGYQQYQYAKKVRDGIIEDIAFLPFIAEAEPDDDWSKEKTWRKANPSLGETISLEYFREQFEEARNEPRKENAFRRYHLNQWTEAETAWITSVMWEGCDGEIDLASLAGKRCYAGLDLASTTDMNALVLSFPDKDGGFDLLPFFFMPEEDLAAKGRRDGFDYIGAVRDGFIETTPGNVTDYDFIIKKLEDSADIYDMAEVAYDPWQALMVAVVLGSKGMTCVEFRQGYKTMSPASKEFERLVLAGKMRHGNNPVLRWMASNVSAKTDPAGNIKPDKSTRNARIDGIVAAIMATGRAAVMSKPRKRKSLAAVI